MKRPWAFICASEGATSKHLRNYCREVYLLGYLPVCPKLQDSQYLVLEDAVERSEYTAIVRDKLLRCPMLVVCSRNQDATTNAQIGLAQKYNRIVTTLDGLKKAVSEGDDLESNLQKTKRAAAEKKIKAAQHALERFEGEILKCLDGTSNFTEDMIAKQIRRYQQELDDAKAEYAELQNARLNEAAEIRKLRTYYDDFKGWAEEFDTAPLEMKRMILSHLIDRVEVGRKYQVIVKFNMKYRQFLECTAETYNTEIGA